ncbi:unnamed protein product [Prunus armeniaca]
MARSMLKAKGLPNVFWAEAIHTSVFILNRSPTKSVKDMTPFEAWHRFKPKVDFFKDFGCIAYAHVPSQKREKFDEKGMEMRKTRARSPIPSARTSYPSSPDSTPRLNIRTHSLADIYESCDLALSALEAQKFEEVVKEKIWQDAMEEEIRVIKKNSTWELVDRPKSKDIIGLKWIYKTKYNEDGSIQKHKARLVAKGYSQQLGVEFNETFALVV